jgi:hypothetical protein
MVRSRETSSSGEGALRATIESAQKSGPSHQTFTASGSAPSANEALFRPVGFNGHRTAVNLLRHFDHHNLLTDS